VDTFDYCIIAGVFFVTAAGGAIAYLKRDYITRGMAVCFFTNLWGVLAMMLSPVSKVRSGDEHDEHSWPPHSWLAVVGTILTILVVVLVRWIISN
jgi:hypothetical protein